MRSIPPYDCIFAVIYRRKVVVAGDHSDHVETSLHITARENRASGSPRWSASGSPWAGSSLPQSALAASHVAGDEAAAHDGERRRLDPAAVDRERAARVEPA